ncbi:MAG: GNAT family N-acetyltransferase [Chloroflexi bacterium]|nr:GNAT family N-acetyltransferase [Chloroflexota bacterium]
MKGTAPVSHEVQIYPLTPERWPDLEALFGKRGASGGCWCMWWRLPRSEFRRLTGEGNKEALKSIVDRGEVPGLLAYHDGQAVGWVSLAPRAAFPLLERSRVLKRVDEQAVWSVVCFFVARPYRRQGMSVQLLQAAVAHARRNGAEIVEGYPVEPKSGSYPDAFAYTGAADAFRTAGFVEVLRRSETRPIMRYTFDKPLEQSA